MLANRRVGKYCIDEVFISKASEIVRESTVGCLVTRAESMFHIKGIEYYALNDSFREIDYLQLIPEYQIMWKIDELNGQQKIKTWFEECDQPMVMISETQGSLSIGGNARRLLDALANR